MLESYGSLLCSAPWDGCTVHWTGAVFPCCSVSDGAESEPLLLGDLKRQSLAEILGGEVAWRLRRAWAEGDIDHLPCGRCARSRQDGCSPYFRTDVDRRFIKPSFRRHGRALEQIRTAPFPVSRIEAQVNATCQLQCSFCNYDTHVPAGRPELKALGAMEPALFERLLDEAIALGGEHAELFTHWYGEPLMHPQKRQIIKASSERPFFWTTLTTNGLGLTPGFVDYLLTLPKLPNVYVSIHAQSREAYRETTGRNVLPKIERNLRHLVQQRSATGRQLEMTIILSSTVTPENVDQLPRFIETSQEMFAQADEPAMVLYNGRGKSFRNMIMIVADGTDPHSAAARQAFWTVEGARRAQQPALEEIAELMQRDAWQDWSDPEQEFLELEERLRLCVVHAESADDRARFQALRMDVLLGHARFENQTDGQVRDMTAGRLLGAMGEPPDELERPALEAFVQAALQNELRFSEETHGDLVGQLLPTLLRTGRHAPDRFAGFLATLTRFWKTAPPSCTIELRRIAEALEEEHRG